jgi:hypothetical protein
MRKPYEAPELIPIGDVHEVVLGSSFSSGDLPGIGAPDFEFEQD